jgi:hypothetical protein
MSTRQQRIFFMALYRALMMIASAVKKAFLDPLPDEDPLALSTDEST